MKRALAILLAALFLLAALPLAAIAADYTVTVNFNDGGRAGYNTYGSSTDFDEIVSGGTFTVGEGNGLTVAAFPNEGYILTDIRRNNDPIDPNLVYTTEDGLYVVDYGDVRSNQTIGFTFEVPNGVNTPFEAQGEPPAQGEPRVVNVYYNGGGTVGYNTTGSSSDFTALASGDGFEVNSGSGMTVGALPDEGYTVTQIYFNWGPFGDGGVIASPIDASWVYLTDEGRFVVDTGNVENDVHLEFVFALLDGDNSFKPTGQPPFGPDDDRPNFDTAIYFPLDGNRFGWDIDATHGSIDGAFINGDGMLEIPTTRGADVRIRIHPQQVVSEEFGPYYPHLGSIYYTDQNGEQFVPYYRMKDVTDPEKEAPYGCFVYETVIQNVQDPIFINFTEDEWYGHIWHELDPDAGVQQLDDIIDVDLTTGVQTFIPDFAGVIGDAGVYKVGDMPAELCDALVSLGFSADDDFIEVINTEWGEPMNFKLLLEFDTPFELELVGEYDEPHVENLLSKIIIGEIESVPDESVLETDGMVFEQFDRNDGIAVFRFDYYFDQATVQRRQVIRIRLQTEQPDGPIDFIYGDVDRDGEVTMKDVLLLRRYIAHLVDESALDLMAADVDLDNSATMKDVLYIRQYIAHLLDALPTVVTPPLDPFELPPVAL